MEAVTYPPGEASAEELIRAKCAGLTNQHPLGQQHDTCQRSCVVHLRYRFEVMQKYALYVREHCPACARVLAWMKGRELEVAVHNVDDQGHTEPPVPLFIFPALFREKKLIAYGDSITDTLANVA